VDRERLGIYTVRSDYITYSAYAICRMAQMMKQKARRLISEAMNSTGFLKFGGTEEWRHAGFVFQSNTTCKLKAETFRD
jgi:D-alanyl-D-alanine dipeptidase